MSNENRELSLDQLQSISGGMKWTRGHISPNVIDARGGQFSFFGITITLDVKGKLSSIGPTP